MDIFHDLKNKIFNIQEKYHNDLIKLAQLEAEKHDILTVNQEMKVKLESSFSNYYQVT